MDDISLPEPKEVKGYSLMELLKQRRTIRSFKNEAISVEQLSYILWSSYGVRRDGSRVVPSAGAIYPHDIYLIDTLGVYHYAPEEHLLSKVREGDIRKETARACLSQMWMAQAPIILCITCEFSRITFRYRERGIRYAYMEAGQIAQNIFLASFNLNLGCGIVGAFDDEKIQEIMGIKNTHEPLLLMPVGYPKEEK